MAKYKNRDMDTRKEEAFEDVAEKIRGVGKTTRRLVDEAEYRAMDIRHSVEDRIRARPITTCAVILVSGVVLGALIRGR
jgi:ElaB/YqjD/DUF883 family membrane-anchored ribosome-binding protein